MQFYEQALSRYSQFPEKQKNYFDIAATLILLMVLIVMIYPAINHILQLNQEIQAGQQVQNALEQKLKDLNQAQNNLAAVTTDLPLAQIALPVGADFKDYLQKPVEKLASSHNLTISSLQFSSVPISDPTSDSDLSVRELNYSLVLTGNYLDFTSFLTDMESFIRTSAIQKLDIKALGSGNTTVSLQIQTHYLGLPLSISQPSTGGT